MDVHHQDHSVSALIARGQAGRQASVLGMSARDDSQPIFQGSVAVRSFFLSQIDVYLSVYIYMYIYVYVLTIVYLVGEIQLVG